MTDNLDVDLPVNVETLVSDEAGNPIIMFVQTEDETGVENADTVVA